VSLCWRGKRDGWEGRRGGGTYTLVVNDLSNDGELAGGGSILDEDDSSDLNESLEGGGGFDGLEDQEEEEVGERESGSRVEESEQGLKERCEVEVERLGKEVGEVWVDEGSCRPERSERVERRGC
jgi:hypothetical protein